MQSSLCPVQNSGMNTAGNANSFIDAKCNWIIILSTYNIQLCDLLHYVFRVYEASSVPNKIIASSFI